MDKYILIVLFPNIYFTISKEIESYPDLESNPNLLLNR
jgi:hypothetical protein